MKFCARGLPLLEFAFSMAICFFTAFGVIPILWASVVALSVLSCESKAMIFSLLLAGFSPLMEGHQWIYGKSLCLG